MKNFLCTFLGFSLIFAMTSCGNSVQEVVLESKTAVTAVPEKMEGKSESKPERLEENSLKNNTQFNFETKTVTLNSGYEMPIYGLGTYSLEGEECVQSVTAALGNGVRLIDTAYMYHNEER